MPRVTDESAVALVRALIADEPPADDGPGGTAGWLQRLCRTAARALPATGAGVSMLSPQGARGVVAASSPASEDLEELQFTLGEGPCIDAFASRQPVLESDLGNGAGARWPAYAPAARERGIQAVFAFPLQIGAARLGVLDVYRDRPGRMSATGVAQALAFAEVAVTALLDGQQNAGEGRSAGGLDDALDYRSELYQAQGMVAVQLGVDLDDAMARLRAYSYSHDRRLADVARDVVGRRVVLSRDDT